MTEQQLRELIELKYGSVRQMALKIDMLLKIPLHIFTSNSYIL